MSIRSEIPGLEQYLIYTMYWIYAGFNILEFSFDWELKIFRALSRVRSILRYTAFTVLCLATLVYTFCMPTVTSEIMFVLIYIEYPVFMFFRQTMNQQRTIVCLNRLLKSVRRTRKLTGEYICFSKSICGLILGRVIFEVAICRTFHNNMPREQFWLSCFFVLMPYANMYVYTQGICVRLFYIQAQLRRLNDNLAEVVYFVILHEVFASNVKEIALVYRRSSMLLRDLVEAHTFDSIIILFQVVLATAVGEKLFARINSAHFFDVALTLHLYATIRSELKRSQTLLETIEIKKNPELMRDLNTINVAAVLGELSVDMHFGRFERAVACAVPVVLLSFAVVGLDVFLQ